MPMGKYYCDYCDKEFQDTPAARRRHLQGNSHLRAKSQWYHSLRVGDPNQDFSAGLPRGFCHRFFKTGFCTYGDSCRYLHSKNNSQSTSIPGFPVSVQTQVMTGNHSLGGSSSCGDTVRDSMGTTWGNLPPSLRPPPENGYPPLSFIDWG